ncbi:hypothetical protein [Methanoregula sp.]|uniref:hypothetical protein n=1 Tax=Methanoregula sp. TaxID=2052170 RepID=UPI002D1809D8|nr:hypothetical protein [Methanoregula sp.]HVP96418.1 hypothetical protein [Methanoregula sp.]
MADIRNFVGFAQNETLVKEYDGLRMYYPVRAKIGIAATSKRLIVYSNVRSFFDPRAESLYQQVNLADIKGIGVVQSRRYRPAPVALGALLLIAGILVAAIGLIGGNLIFEAAGIGCVITGIILILAGVLWRQNLFRFEIWGTAWTLSVGEFENVRPFVIPGPDLLKVVEELGALVIEIQEGTLYTGE